MTKQELFIERSNKIHNFYYSYDNVVYIGDRFPVTITCPVHGNFEQRVGVHVIGKGCSKCASERRSKINTKNKENFIELSNKAHDNKYDYSDSNYKNRNTKVKIICPIHGGFTQFPKVHIKGHGCKECAKENSSKSQSMGIESFVKQSILVHGYKYDYSLVDYKNNRTKIKIVCKEHGSFWQLPDTHIYQKSGCPQCYYENGACFTKEKFINYNPDGAILYIVELKDETTSFIKVGITGRTLKRRFIDIPYQYKLLHQIKTDSANVHDIEKYFKKTLRNFKYKPQIDFGGKTECYTQEALPEIRNYLFNF